MGLTSLTFTVSGVEDMLMKIGRVQERLGKIDTALEKDQLAKSLLRVENLLSDAQSAGIRMCEMLEKIKAIQLDKTAKSTEKLAGETKKAADAAEKLDRSTQGVAKASDGISKTAAAQKSMATSAKAAHDPTMKLWGRGGLLSGVANQAASFAAGYASITTAINLFSDAVAANNRMLQESYTASLRYGDVLGTLAAKADNMQQLGTYDAVVNKLTTSGAVKDKTTAASIAQAMLSAGAPVEAIESMIVALQGGIMTPTEVAGIIKASGPLMKFNPELTMKQILNMGTVASKSNVSDMGKIVQGVADSAMMAKEMGFSPDEMFAAMDVVAQSTHNADEARTWMKGMNKDVWQKSMARFAEYKMKQIDPNATTMEGFIAGRTKTGDPIIDSSFRTSMEDYTKWAKVYYTNDEGNVDQSKFKKDFKNIRSMQGMLALINGIRDGSYQKSLDNVRQYRHSNIANEKAEMALQTDEVSSAVRERSLTNTLNELSEPEAFLSQVHNDRLYKARTAKLKSEGSSGWGPFFANTLGATVDWTRSYANMGMGIYQSEYATQQEKQQAAAAYATIVHRQGRQSKDYQFIDRYGTGKSDMQLTPGESAQLIGTNYTSNDYGFFVAVGKALEQIEAAATEQKKAATSITTAAEKQATAADKQAANATIPAPQGQNGRPPM